MRIFLSMAVVATLSWNHASAQQFTLGNWSGWPFNDQAGAFSHCGMTAPYVHGTSLLFSVNRDWQWSIAFANDAWSLPVGTQIQLRYFVDKSPLMSGVATANTPTLVEMTLPVDSELFGLFRRGQVLTVFAQGQEFNFALTGTSNALVHLTRCVEISLAAQPSAPPRVATAPNLELRKSAVAFARTLIETAGLSGATLLDITEMPETLKDYSVAFVHAGTIVALREHQGRQSPQMLAAGLAVADASGCIGGQFATQPLTATHPRIGRAAGICQTPAGDRMEMRYTVIQMEEGLFIEIGAINVSDPDGLELTDGALNTVLLSIADQM